MKVQGIRSRMTDWLQKQRYTSHVLFRLRYWIIRNLGKMTLISKSRSPVFVFKLMWTFFFFLIFNWDNSVSLHPAACCDRFSLLWIFFCPFTRGKVRMKQDSFYPPLLLSTLMQLFSYTVTLQIQSGITLYYNDHAHIIFCIYKWLWLEMINDYVTHRLSGLKGNPHESNTNQDSYHDAWGSLQHQTYRFFPIIASICSD